jgi:hypothetical protein
MIAAFGVLVSHAYPLTQGPGTPEPFTTALLGKDLGNISVDLFFAISGFLISKSFVRDDNPWAFWRARAMRIWPGLFVALIVTVIVGTALTTVPMATYTAKAPVYVLQNMTLISMKKDLPGLFENIPYSRLINGSLWTLGRVDKAHPAMDCGYLNKAEEARGGLVVAGGDASKLLEKADHALDAIALGVSRLVQRAGLLAVGSPRNDRVGSLQIKLGAQVVAVVTLVGQQLARALLSVGQQGGGGGNIGRLAGRQMHCDGKSMRLGQHMNFGAEATTRPA